MSTGTPSERLGAFLRAARKEADMTQMEAAEAIGCQVADLSRYENGHQSPTLFRSFVMCDVYGATVTAMRQAVIVTADS